MKSRPTEALLPKPCPLPARPSVPELSPDGRQFDRDVSRALSRRKLAPEATIDLHGMTLAAAERAVTRFLERVTAQDMRVVLVVTGKGLAEKQVARAVDLSMEKYCSVSLMLEKAVEITHSYQILEA